MSRELFGYEAETLNIDYNRIFLLSDLHFGIRANSLEWLENQESFFKDFYIPWLKENMQDGDILFVLGDWFDNRQLLDILVMNVSIDIVEELASIIPLYFITGNHDIYKKKDTDVHSLRSFKSAENVTIFEKPVIVTNGKSSIFALPWVGSKKEEELYAKANEADYLFAHTDISGFMYDNGHEIIKGANLLKDTGFKKVISGHIHKRQQQGNGYYVGSPYHTKRSDIGNVKGVWLLHPDENKLEFKENEHSPIFQKLRLETLMEYTLDEAYNKLKNNYTDIIVPDKYIHLFSLPRFISLLADCPYKRLEAAGEKDKLDDEETIMRGENTKDLKTLIEEGIESKNYNKEVIEKLKELNSKYYKMSSEE